MDGSVPAPLSYSREIPRRLPGTADLWVPVTTGLHVRGDLDMWRPISTGFVANVSRADGTLGGASHRRMTIP